MFRLHAEPRFTGRRQAGTEGTKAWWSSSLVFWQGLQSSGNFLSTEGPRQAGSEGSWLWWLLGVEPS